jgi:Flp pilus assembly protein TadG
MKHRRIQDERGQTMVEFALVIPVLFMVLFGIIQFGILYNDYVTVTDAARVGARKGAVSRTTANPAGLAEAAARNAASGLNQAALDVLITAPVWSPGADIKVELTYPYSIKLFGMALVTGELESATTERIE